MQFFGAMVQSPNSKKRRRNEDDDGAFVIDDSLVSGDEESEMEDDRVHWEDEDDIPKVPDRWSHVTHMSAPRDADMAETPGASTSASTLGVHLPGPSTKPSSKSSKPPSTSRQKPKSKSSRPPNTGIEGAGDQLDLQHTSCPICGKAFHVDNAGLNEHVDYCLSKGTIAQATSGAVSNGGKPNSKAEFEFSDNERIPKKKRIRSPALHPAHLFDFGIYKKSALNPLTHFCDIDVISR